MLIEGIRQAAVMKGREWRYDGLARELSCGLEPTQNSWKVFISEVRTKWLLLT